MNRVVWFVVFGVLSGATPLSAVAAEQAVGNAYMMLGAGPTSCGAWTQDHKSNPKSPKGYAEDIWVTGYITAMNLWYLPRDRGISRNLAEGTDVDGLAGWIDNYCSANPLDNIADAAEALAVELATKWFAAHPPLK